MSGQAGNNERPQEGRKETFKVLWTDEKHPEPQTVRLRFYSKSRADLCAEQIATGSPGVTVWVEKETAAAESAAQKGDDHDFNARQSR